MREENGADLIKQGRRWILAAVHEAGGKWRAAIVVEGCSGFFPLGTVSNMPGTLPPVYLDKREDAREWTKKNLKLNDMEYSEILLSSIQSQNRDNSLTARYMGDGVTHVINGHGDRMAVLDEEQAHALYRSLAEAWDWPWGKLCEECHGIQEVVEPDQMYACEGCEYEDDD